MSRYTPSPEGALMKEFRVRANLTQQMLSDRMGVSRGSISVVEIGFWRPGEAMVHKLAVALRLSLGEEQRLLAARNIPWKRVRSDASPQTP